MAERRTAKLFTHGGSQAVRLPKEFRFQGVSEVGVEWDGHRVVLSPAEPKRGPDFWAEIDTLRADEQLSYSQQPILDERDWNW
jgi:antitoxin VapB